MGDRTSRWLADKDVANRAAFDSRPEKPSPDLGPNGIALIARRALLGGFGTKMRPFVAVDGGAAIAGYWGTTFHPLDQGSHALSVWFSHQWGDGTARFGLATSIVLVTAGEWHRLDYTGPWLAKRLRSGKLLQSP